MKKLILSFCIVLICLGVKAQQKPDWTKWTPLFGTWEGGGSGKPGQGGGSFSFSPELDQRVIIRKSHSEYPAAGDKPAVIHDDLMIIYPDNNGVPSKAIYFDNEGHIIEYAVTYADKQIILLSGKTVNMPYFRLTYTLTENNGLDTKFEMSQDGQKFMTYVQGQSKKVK